ncbi:Poly-beta-1,6-N-acetyl-D-glucosamine synthase [Gimesia panareensis]|uniref:Poly-beta-1,6-N-acetyl-D-glucosamine synthase n=1 Tax=Gimesia panareensis TaxID=2527978 RepID=A0A518FTM5_9PLAN|nr:glycosyltransferase [Gimesia panareensis]QDV19696.1 Poly-beta-1,6-N-acetyl-D-glucosamine synthase [Gimesia panareensis]
MSGTLITFWGYTTIAFWLVLLGPSLVMMLRKRVSRCVSHTEIPAEWPRISVIVPAKDEAETLEANLNSLLASDYPDLEIIAVNDRSTDETGAIMERVAARATTEKRIRMQVLHIEELPADWLGKSHAMYQGTQQATGELLLFTDGDIIFSRHAIADATRIFLKRKLDHLCLLPQLAQGSLIEMALITFFGFLLTGGTFLWLVPTCWNFAYLGIGAFNLIRRDVYEQIGGHATIKLDVLDDIKLGKLVKNHGYQQDFYLGIEELKVRWQPSAWGVITGVEKNSFASFQYSVIKLSLVTLLYILVFLVPFVMPFLFPLSQTIGFVITIVLLHLCYAAIGVLFAAGLRVTPFLLFASLALAFAIWRSAWIILKNGGVRWRDTIYPLDLLKRNLY